MKKWIATLGNFFLPGVGYMVIGQRRLVALMWLVGVLGLTYVEFGIQEPLPSLYWTMFVSVFIMNTGFALDVWREATRLERA